MAPRSLFSPFLCLFSLLTLTACVSQATTPPTVDQNAVATGVAATVEAAFTSTQHAISAMRPTGTHTSTLAPTLPAPTITPTIAQLPTLPIPYDAAIQVAYLKEGDVYLWTDRQGSMRLTELYDVVSLRLSDDAELIAFKRQNPDDVTLQELWVVNTRGVPVPKVLVSSEELAELMPPKTSQSILGYGVLDFTWRPNTHELAYNTVVLHIGPGFGPNHDLRLVNADTLEKTILLEKDEGGLFYYSPDGSQIALSNPESISIMKADGSDLRADVLTFPSVITYSEYEYHPHPIWANDSRTLAVTIPPHDPEADPLPPTSLWSISVDGSPPVLFGYIQAMPFAWPDNAFAPNLKHVAYATPVGSPTGNQRELRLAHPDGSDETVFDKGESLEFISWSPNSQHFIYQIPQGANKGVYLGGLNTKPKMIVYDPNVIQNIEWLGNNRVVFPYHDGNQWLLFIQNLNNSQVDRIDIIPDDNPAFDVVNERS
jgi:hypothetical protein